MLVVGGTQSKSILYYLRERRISNHFVFLHNNGSCVFEILSYIKRCSYNLNKLNNVRCGLSCKSNKRKYNTLRTLQLFFKVKLLCNINLKEFTLFLQNTVWRITSILVVFLYLNNSFEFSTRKMELNHISWPFLSSISQMKSILVRNKQNRHFPVPEEDLILRRIEKLFTRFQNAKKLETLTRRVRSWAGILGRNEHNLKWNLIRQLPR